MSHRKLNGNEIHWRLTTGCTEIGPGCDSCPAMSNENPHVVKLWTDRLSLPSSTKERTLFYLSLGSDFFQDEVPDKFIMDAFRVMNVNPQHLFVVLTKRSGRLRQLAPKLLFGSNIYMGVTVASKSCKPRIEDLRTVKTDNRFLSIAPLLEDLGDLNMEGIRSVGIAEETWGPKRQIDQSWVENIERQCQEQNVIFKFEDAILYKR